MKQFDFDSGFFTESKQEPQQINEFLGTLLVAGALGFFVMKGSLSIFNQIQTARNQILKARTERVQAKIEHDQIKDTYKASKEEKKIMKQNLKMTYAWANSINAMPEGPEKDKKRAQLQAQLKFLNGTADADTIKQLQVGAKEKPKGADDLEARIQEAAKKISDAAIKKYCEETGTPYDEEKIAQALDKSTLQITAGQQQAQGAQGTQGAAQTQGTQGAQGTPDQTQGAQGTPKPEGDPKPDEEYVDDDGTKYTKIGDKYTMTTKDGDVTELTQDEYETHIESDDVKDAERIDNDDDIEDLDYSSKEDLAKDPRKKYKQRTYKRGSKTFKTKTYYDKKGNSISKDDFKKMYDAWKERQSNGKKKTTQDNNSLFSVTRLIDIKKTPANMNEAKMSTDREGICKERLVYIKYVMDTTSNSVEKVKMERMYNAIYNLTFNTNGELRTLDDLYTYLNETMVENKGTIPGLPTNDQIMNIDEKVKAFKELHEEKFKAYLNRLEKENLDKAKTEKNDAAKDLLSDKQPKSDTEALDEIKKISSIPGLTNILGLESNRKMSVDDVNKQKEVEKQHKDGSPNAKQPSEKDVNPEDISDEDISKIMNGETE